MKIDAKWFLPFALPFAFILLMNGVYFVAGAKINPEKVASLSFLVGFVGGSFVAVIMALEGIKWPITICKWSVK